MSSPCLEIFGYTRDGENYEIVLRTTITEEFARTIAKRYERLAGVLSWEGCERSGPNAIRKSLSEIPLPRLLAQPRHTQKHPSTRAAQANLRDEAGPPGLKPHRTPARPLSRASRKQNKRLVFSSRQPAKSKRGGKA